MIKYNSITSITGQEQEGTVFKAPATPEFIRLTESFTHWLWLLNFEPTTTKYGPKKIQEFLSWLESKHILDIKDITSLAITNYFQYLTNRKNQRKGGKLSKNSLRTHITILRKFARYLRESEGETFDVSLQIKGELYHVRDLFTRAEIKALYEASGSDLLGLRDRAMLAVYYGCGLRRSEGINLDVKDILLERNLLYVRKGKNYKERYVPMTEAVKEDVKNYIEFVRPTLIQRDTHALFLNQSGVRFTGESMICRLHKLKEKAGIDKDAGLHSLRHSIATHLLQSGMELEKIKQFLGHSSLESTQIYTHIAHANK
jgi:site-specific recombinase XerD